MYVNVLYFRVDESDLQNENNEEMEEEETVDDERQTEGGLKRSRRMYMSSPLRQ